ncbi:MAG: type II toxin-antitoxin system RelE/ParE family toxin [Acidobacteriota bacterium]|nr:type II toxin-antitoxin system RelE/ParE family toxin [Acidobacteriota bacterium]
MKVLWTDAAVAQLEAIHNYVAQTSPEYARRIVDKLTRRSIQIAAFPFSGRMVPEYELNEVRELIEGSHRIIYLVKEEKDQIEVLAVIHSAREGLMPLD